MSSTSHSGFSYPSFPGPFPGTPAQRLAIGIYLQIDPLAHLGRRDSWACFVVASFYNEEGLVIWHKQVCILQTHESQGRGWSAVHRYDQGPPPPPSPEFYPPPEHLTMSYYGRLGGTNPRWGRDTGPAPPQAGGQAWGAQALPYAFVPQDHVPGMTSGTTRPAGQPVRIPTLPGVHMTNSTGGVGCEPGYHYLFAPEHTKIHLLETGATPPWALPPHAAVPYVALHAACSMTVGDLLRSCGATGRDPRANRVVEVATNPATGRMYRGLCFAGNDADAMARDLRSVGWDRSRDGRRKPVVQLYVVRGE